MVLSRLMMKEPEWCYIGLTFKEERICFEFIKLVEHQIGVE